MTNFIFKSPSDLQKIRQQMLMIQSELRHQRSDLAVVIGLCNRLVNNSNLQTQVDEYYESHPDRELDDK